MKTAPIFVSAVLVILAVTPDARAQDATPRPLPRNLTQYGAANALVPYQSAALPDGASALGANPAAYGINDGVELDYFHGWAAGAASTSDAVFLNLDGLGFAFQTRYDDLEWRKYSIPLGMKAGDMPLYTGLSFDIIDPVAPDYSTRFDFNAGLLWRFWDFFSFGLVGRHLNRPDFNANGEALRRELDLALGVQPFTKKLRLGIDFAFVDDGADPKPVVQAQLGPFHGFMLSGNADTAGERFGAGLYFDLFHGGVAGDFQAAPGSDAWTLTAGVRCNSFRRDGPHTRGDVVVITLDETVESEHGAGEFLDLFAPPRRSLAEILHNIRRAARDPDVGGILFRVKTGFAYRLSEMWELQREVTRFREVSDKPVFVYGDSLDKNAALLASAADEVFVAPAGAVTLEGFNLSLVYLKNTLDWIGVRFDMFRRAEYKSAAEPLVADAPSTPTLQALEALLDTTWNTWVPAVAKGRNLPEATVRDIVDHRPLLSASAARERGLIDRTLYYDEIEDYLARRFNHHVELVEDYFDRVWAETRWSGVPTIAVIEITGAIVEGGSGFDLLFGNTVGADTIVAAIEAAAEDDNVAAIVARVNSPGGSGLASDLILRALMKAQKEKPVVVSMGSVAASGGYFVSCAADKILATPYTITGSIGVITVSLDASTLLKEKLKMTQTALKRGAMADALSVWRAMTPEEHDLMDAWIGEFYQLFVQRVADGRRMRTDKVHALARGRVWSGADAKANGLIDKLGNLADAIDLAKERARLRPDDDVRLRVLPEMGLLQRASQLFTGTGARTELKQTAHELLTQPDTYLERRIFGDRPALMLPYRIEVK